MKLQKTRLQILLDAEDLLYLHHFDASGEKNASEVIHELIYDHKLMTNSIEKFKTKLIEEAKKEKYEDVRTEQIKKSAPDPMQNDKWAFLRGKPIDQEKEKSTVKFTKKKR